ncbi:uncharacterized protein LOC116345636 isoform X2 [Contarinia nasturtii]|nr:uncharacterized protein LOC116345636 isoform X2 [Contarinia nasturtii]XP_031631014.1 uncharacterized protein LOC116345636 isoform X2 [Contarinia nasturtii]
MPPLDEMKRKDSATNAMFRREIYVYKNVLPAFIAFQREKGLSAVDSFVSFPKVFESEMSEENETCFLIMEDLRPKNFEMWPKEQTIAIDHELLVMRELGKLHAVSFAMKDQCPDKFDEFKCLRDQHYENALENDVGEFVRKTIGTTTEILEQPKHKEFMQNFRNAYLDMVRDYLLGESSEEFAVINHQDCWITNFLFQNTNDNKTTPKSMCLLDWQAARYCPPVLDILYHVFSSTDREFRDKHYDTLLKTYYRSLSETIEKLGSAPEKLYTYDDFQRQLRKFGAFTVLCAPLLILLRVTKAHNETSTNDNDQDKRDAVFNNFDETQKTYVKMINDLFHDLEKYGYIMIN